MLILVLAEKDDPALGVLQTIDAEFVFGGDPQLFSADQLERAEVVLNGSHDAQTLRALWPKLHSVKWIHSLSAGVEDILFPELRESSIPLTNARGVYKRSLGEWAMLAMLYFAKDVPRLMAQREQALWQQFDCLMLENATVAIIGYGEIGRDVAARAKAFGMRVIATRRRADAPHDGLADEVFSSDEREEVMRRADYVVVSAALTPDTRKIVGRRELQAMKPSAILINVGRGALVDEPALVDVLQKKQIGGAALDVFETEPLPEDHPLWKLDNILLSPHSADHTSTWRHDTVAFFIRNFERFQKGQPLENIVDKQAGY